MADLGPFCAPVGQNGGQKGQSAAVPFTVVIKHLNFAWASYFLWQT